MRAVSHVVSQSETKSQLFLIGGRSKSPNLAKHKEREYLTCRRVGSLSLQYVPYCNAWLETACERPPML